MTRRAGCCPAGYCPAGCCSAGCCSAGCFLQSDVLQGVVLHPAQPVGMGLSLGHCGRDVGPCQDPRDRAVPWGRLKDGAVEGGSGDISLGEGRLRAGEPLERQGNRAQSPKGRDA